LKELIIFHLTGVLLIVSFKRSFKFYKNVIIITYINSITACTAERFFRVDRAQEHLHYVVDICTDDLYLLDPADDQSQEDVATNAVSNFVISVNTSLDDSNDLKRYRSENNNTIILFKPSNDKSSDNSKLSDSDISDFCKDDNSSLLNLKMSDDDGSKKEDIDDAFVSANDDIKGY